MKALLVALLLVLAASPLTAPFSVHTPVDVHKDLTWTSPKNAANDLKSDGALPVGVDVPGADWSVPTPDAAPSPTSAQNLHRFPLRI